MPLTWLIRYQAEPALLPAQTVLQAAPRTLPVTVTVPLERRALTVAPVDAPVRRFTPTQAGAMVVDAVAPTPTGRAAVVATSAAASRVDAIASRPRAPGSVARTPGSVAHAANGAQGCRWHGVLHRRRQA